MHQYGESLVICGIALAACFVAEGISWLLIYRLPSYKALTSAIDRTSKKLDTLKSSGTTSKQQRGTKARKLDRYEGSLKTSTRNLAAVKFRSGFLVAIVFLALYGLLSNVYDGRVVAKLPFTPVAFIRGATHRGVHGDDWTETGAVFLWVLCSLCFRPNVQKFLGFAPPRSTMQWMPPSLQENPKKL
eukprot:jgi/Chlat1/553/Chrsp103S01126